MKKKYERMKYGCFVRRLFLICVMVWIVFQIMFLILKDSFELLCIIVPATVSVVLIISSTISRRLVLKKLAMIRLDFHTIYELDKRRRKGGFHDLYLLMYLHFYDGDFQKAVQCCDKLLQLNSRPEAKYNIRFYKILALFFLQKTEDIFSLIEVQRQNSNKKKRMLHEPYYVFIEKYLKGQYDEAVNAIRERLRCKNNKLKNNTKVKVYYLMRIAFLREGDSAQAQNCLVEVLLADKKRNTFFSKNLRSMVTESKNSSLLNKTY